MGMNWMKKEYIDKVKSGKDEILQQIGLPKLIIIILAGIVLLVTSLPSGWIGSADSSSSGESQSSKSEESDSDDALESTALDAMDVYADRQEEKLESILQQVDGIGQVDVMITMASSEEKMTLQDVDTQENTTDETDSAGGERKQDDYSSKNENVIVESDGEESPYVVQVNSPEIEGVVVVAKGADTGTKDTEIIEAVEALFSIESHKIKVMKME